MSQNTTMLTPTKRATLLNLLDMTAKTSVAIRLSADPMNMKALSSRLDLDPYRPRQYPEPTWLVPEGQLPLCSRTYVV